MLSECETQMPYVRVSLLKTAAEQTGYSGVLCSLVMVDLDDMVANMTL